MDINTTIDKYIRLFETPNKSIGGTYISKYQKKRSEDLKKAKINPSLKLDIRTNSLMIELDGEWLDLTSPLHCVRFSNVVLKYPEIYQKI